MVSNVAEFVRHRRHSYRFNANKKIKTLRVENTFGTAPTPWHSHDKAFFSYRFLKAIAKETFAGYTDTV